MTTLRKPEPASARGGGGGVNVNFNIDVNKLLSDIFGGGHRNDLLVTVANGTLRDATILDSIHHGKLASVRGSRDVSPVDLSRPSMTANFWAAGVKADGYGSDILLQIDLGRHVVSIMCRTPPTMENYYKYTVTQETHSPEAIRNRIAKTAKRYASHANASIRVDDFEIWVDMTQESPAMCNIQLREKTDLIAYDG